MTSDKSPVFLTAALGDPALVARVLGLSDLPRLVVVQNIAASSGVGFPRLQDAPGAELTGTLLAHTPERLGFLMDCLGLEATQIPLEFSGADPVLATTYAGEVENLAPEALGDPALLAETFDEIMWHFRRRPAKDVRRFVSQFFVRARARLAALDHAPQSIRQGHGAVRLQALERPYLGYFSIEERDLRFPRFDGDYSEPVHRAGLMVPDAVTVLPYDPQSDLVLLIEQFRYGPFMRGDPVPWQLEAIAGHVDPGETCEETAIREAREEAGLTLSGLEKIGGYYSSPGAFSEYLTGYIGFVDLSTFAESVHGLAVEAEDIRAFTLPFADLMAAVENGEVDNGPLLISALWLARHRERLRANSATP